MPQLPVNFPGNPDLQEFVDEGGITDPAILAALDKKLKRPRKRSPWFGRLLVAGAVILALLVGMLIGRFLL